MEADNYRYNEDMLDDPVLPSMSGESMDLKACLRQRELYEMLGKVTRQLGYEPNASGTYSYRKYAISMVCRALGYHKATRVAQHNRASAPAVNAADASAVQNAADKTAKAVLATLDLSGDGRLNYRMFISWWQKQLKANAKHHHLVSISDEELQSTMVIWHTTNDDGSGVDAKGLASVIAQLIKQGVIKITADGHVIPRDGALSQHQVEHKRERGLTGIDGRLRQ